MPDLIASLTGISEWVHSRQWDFYRFASPLVGLVVQLSSKPFKKSLAAQHDRRLSEAGISDSGERTLFLRIAKDWDLRTSYFTTAITTFFSVAAITHAFSGTGNTLLFAITIVILLIVAIIIYPRIFQDQLGRISTPFTGEGAKTKFQRWLNKKKWTEADFYSYLLRWLNVLLLLLILITTPAQSTSQTSH